MIFNLSNQKNKKPKCKKPTRYLGRDARRPLGYTAWPLEQEI